MKLTPELLDAAFEARDALLNEASSTERRQKAGRDIQAALDQIYREQVDPIIQAALRHSLKLPDGSVIGEVM